MENTINLKRPVEGHEVTYEVDMSALDSLVAKQRTEFITRLCRYDIEATGAVFEDLPKPIRSASSMVGEVPAFTCEEDKQAHVERVQKCIEDSRNDIKREVYQMAV
ncbi:hypothetical protein LCGC14_1098100 [marine sediment metagenome]|uniref:Uncharacterized protein n=1 Tax=marine sediment metagenome TaxID=412755 RepID=A0A0F9QGE5_9ZZZZ